jgi:hypothetical protein
VKDRRTNTAWPADELTWTRFISELHPPTSRTTPTIRASWPNADSIQARVDAANPAPPVCTVLLSSSRRQSPKCAAVVEGCRTRNVARARGLLKFYKRPLSGLIANHPAYVDVEAADSFCGPVRTGWCRHAGLRCRPNETNASPARTQGGSSGLEPVSAYAGVQPLPGCSPRARDLRADDRIAHCLIGIAHARYEFRALACPRSSRRVQALINATRVGRMRRRGVDRRKARRRALDGRAPVEREVGWIPRAVEQWTVGVLRRVTGLWTRCAFWVERPRFGLSWPLAWL